MKTIFSKILDAEIPASFVYRSETVAAFMDIQPVNQGHVLVVPVVQVKYLHELDDEICAELMNVAKRISMAIRNSGVSCEGVNLYLADGESAGQEVPHVHLHVFPRFMGDGFGLKFGTNYTNLPPRSELDSVAEKIKQAFEDAIL